MYNLTAMNKKIILASQSPRRKALMQQIGLDFSVIPSQYEEKLNPRLKPKGQAELLSREKANEVMHQFQGEDVIILAADSVIDFRGETIGKPKSTDDAKRILRRLSGEMHEVITAFTLIDARTKRTVTKSVATKVFMKKLTKKELDGYIATNEPMDKAGAYGIQEMGAVFVERIEGDFYGVVGLPIQALTEELKRFGVMLY